jgi:inner membrane transporter RhtA
VRFGLALLLISTVSVQFGSAFAGLLMTEVGALTVNLCRAALAAVALGLIVRPKAWRWSWSQLRPAIALGVVVFGMNTTFYLSIERLPIGVAVSLEFFGPLVLSAVLSRRPRDFLFIGIAALGIGVMGVEAALKADHLDPIGIVYALVAGVFWALYILAAAKVGEVIEGQGGLTIAFFVATLLAFPLGVSGLGAVFADWRLIGLALVVGVLAAIIPYTFEFLALKRVPKRVFGVLMSVEPAIATLSGWLVLEQAGSPWRLGAIALVVIASVGITLGARKVVEVNLPLEDLHTGTIELPIAPAQVSEQPLPDRNEDPK